MFKYGSWGTVVSARGVLCHGLACKRVCVTTHIPADLLIFVVFLLHLLKLLLKVLLYRQQRMRTIYGLEGTLSCTHMHVSEMPCDVCLENNHVHVGMAI